MEVSVYIYKGIFGTCGSELDPLVGAIKEGFQEQVTLECGFKRYGMCLVEKKATTGLARKVTSPEELVGVSGLEGVSRACSGEL